MSHLLFDLRDVFRGLRRDRLYVGTVIGTLALTLGASAAVFSIVDGVLASLMFEGRARDPLVIAGVVALMGAVGLAACATAAKQGLRINPAAALRDE
jgi:ABC-type antimicrobial peptide transport system permease subunit